MIEVTESYVKNQMENIEKQIAELKTKNSTPQVLFRLGYLEPQLSAFRSVYDFIQGQKQARI